MKSQRLDSIRIKNFLPVLKVSCGVMEDSRLVGCYAASLGECFAKFRKKTVAFLFDNSRIMKNAKMLSSGYIGKF